MMKSAAEILPAFLIACGTAPKPEAFDRRCRVRLTIRRRGVEDRPVDLDGLEATVLEGYR